MILAIIWWPVVCVFKFSACVCVRAHSRLEEAESGEFQIHFSHSQTNSHTHMHTHRLTRCRRLCNNTQVLQVHAEDGDKGNPREIRYGLVSEGNPFTSFFDINDTTGEFS